MDGRECTLCRKWKSADAFSRRKDEGAKRTGNVLWARCKSCLAALAAKHRATPEYRARVERRREETPSYAGNKQCSRCKKNRPRRMFFRASDSADLLMSWCRECTRAAKAERYRSDAEYRAKTQRLARESKRRRYRESAKYREALKREKESPAGKARAKLHWSLANGTITKPERCQKCGRKGTGREIQGHHHLGYAPEHALDVIWLCIPCHVEAHE